MLIVARAPEISANFARNASALTAQQVVFYLSVGAGVITSVYVVGQTVRWIQKLYWQPKVERLHEEVDDLFKQLNGRYNYNQNKLDTLMRGIDVQMQQGAFPQVRQSYNEARELLSSGDNREVVFANPAQIAAVPSSADRAMKSMNTGVNRLAEKAPGGIDLGRTAVSVENSGGEIQMAFDDPAMLRLLLNSDGLAPIIYDIKTMTPSMENHFVGLN